MNELLKNRYSKWMSILEFMIKDECLDEYMVRTGFPRYRVYCLLYICIHRI